MTTSYKGKDIIKSFESLRTDSYICPAGKWTIGWGHTKGVKMGQHITKQQAEDMLVEDIAPIERMLNAVGINFRQEQFDALVSWIFNLGMGNFSKSTMLKRIVEGADDEKITDEMVKWVFAGKQRLPGLARRRVAEANLFIGYDRYGFRNGEIYKI